MHAEVQSTSLEGRIRDDTISSEDIAAAFTHHYNEARIEPIYLDEVPKAALDKFESKSQQFVFIDDYVPKNFDNMLRIRHKDGSASYVATQAKTYKGIGETERLTYVVDLTHDEELQGYGEMRFNISNDADYFRCKPFVGFTGTEEKHQRKGLGARRLYLMNALAMAIHSAPLNSDTLLNDAARRIWERLVEKEAAHRYMEGEHTRYVFTEEMPGWHSTENIHPYRTVNPTIQDNMAE